ncbi:MAG TPA: hypothetical protein VKZ72_00665 [Acidimicrobiales bacterium]|nr:hypothetical protein [Acidimicrobiales bacterium]
MEDPRAGGWAVPGASGDVPAPDAAIPVDAAPVVDDDAPPAGGAVPTVALRPMTVADILDGGFAVVKARPLRIMSLAAVFVVPTHLVVAWLQRDLGGAALAPLVSSDPVVLEEQTRTTGGDILAMVLAIVLPAVALVCIAAAIGHLVGQWLMGRDAPAGEMARAVGRHWPALLGSFVAVKLAEIASAFGCYIGLLFVMPLFVAVAPAIGVERCGAGESMRRSIRLVRNRYFPTMGIALLMGLVASVIAQALAAVPQSLALWVGYDVGWPLLALGSIVAQTLVLPFVGAATVLLYFDLRVRGEGLDLEMAARAVLDRAG